MKWPQIVVVLLGVLSVALAVRFRGNKPAVTDLAPPVTMPGEVGRPLPLAFDRPGLVSRRVGLLRVYVAVTEEIRLEASPSETTHRAVAVPISIVFENDTYRPLAASEVGWIGGQLCSVRVVRVEDDQRETEVYQTDLPLPARADWLSAERRSVTATWPLRDIAAGNYRISVQLALADQPVVEIVTRVL